MNPVHLNAVPDFHDSGPASGQEYSGHAGRAVIDLNAIRHNVEVLRSSVATAEVMAVVKADAYGHGLLKVAEAALEGGATWLGAAQIGEAVALRRAGFTCRILTWLYAPAGGAQGAIDAAAQHDLDISVSAPWALDEALAAGRRHDCMVRVHLKVDTGLGRNGASASERRELFAAAQAAEATGVVRVLGIWSHFALADDPGHPTVLGQIEEFERAIADGERAGLRFEVRHLANSAATLTEPRAHFDLVRPGLAVYGLSPVPQVKSARDFNLVPAMTVSAPLALVKNVASGQGVSYGHTYVTENATTLGLVPLGYSDGVPRHAGNKAPVTVAGERHQVAGRVCMDQFVVDLGPGSSAAAGDQVVLFGSGPDAPSADEWADAAETISYEIVTRMSSRLPRTYVGERIVDDVTGQRV
ncbi:alanine racemase [Micrococcales bacterium 31B]|nr:alanine racemase [Micrococcales bacterium 31B]